MPVKTFRPLNAVDALYHDRVVRRDHQDQAREEPRSIRKKTGGRNCYGRVTAAALAAGTSKRSVSVDFKRHKHGVEATVVAIEYDPIRSARLALLEYKDGERATLSLRITLKVGAKFRAARHAPPEVGNSLPLRSDSGRPADP